MALISHRLLMPKLLMFKEREGWPTVHRLLLCHLRFLKPFLVAGTLGEVGRTLYTGTVRIFLILLHDFPTFLAVYYHSLVSALPPHCIQLTNLILAAYPGGVKLCDPFEPGFKLEKVPEARLCPTIVSDFSTVLELGGVREKIESVLAGHGVDRTGLVECVRRRMKEEKENTFVNAVVLYVGVRTIGEGDAACYDGKAPAAVMLKELIEGADVEGEPNTLTWNDTYRMMS